MEIMTNIDDATLGEMRITKVEEKREAIQKVIKYLIKANK
jgi:hypothetical protein